MGCGVERDIKAGLKNSSDVFGEDRERREVSQKSRIFDVTWWEGSGASEEGMAWSTLNRVS